MKLGKTQGKQETEASRRPRTGIMEGWNIGTLGKLEYRIQASGGWQCQEYWKIESGYVERWGKMAKASTIIETF